MKKTFSAIVLTMIAALVLCLVGCSSASSVSSSASSVTVNQISESLSTSSAVNIDSELSQKETLLQVNVPVSADKYELTISGFEQIEPNATGSYSFSGLVKFTDDNAVCLISVTFKNTSEYALDVRDAFRGIVSIDGIIEQQTTMFHSDNDYNDFVEPQQSKDFIIAFAQTESTLDRCSSIEYRFGFAFEDAEAQLKALPVIYAIDFEV